MHLVPDPPTTAEPEPGRPVLLALRALNLGDLLVAVPALRALRRHWPEHELLLATNPAHAPVVDLMGAVDRLVPHRGLHPPAVLHPDIAVDLHGVLPDSVRALQAVGPQRLVAFATEGHPDGPQPDPGEHEVQRWCRLVAWAGAQPEPDDLLLPAPDVPTTHPGATLVHPGAAWGSKRWPADRFATVARELVAAGHDVVVTGSPAERELTEQVRVAAGLPWDADLGGRTSVESLLALVARARLVVTGDTGVAHLATAFARPSVVLFGPASPRLWGPPRRPYHRALWHGDGEREVLVDEPDPVLLAIDVSEVLSAVDEVVAAGALSYESS